jgi:hypothetical protein
MLQILGISNAGLRPRRLQHVQEQIGRREHDYEKRCAQDARRVRVHGKGPPQVIGELDVAERQKRQPDGGGDDPGNTDRPDRCEAFVQNGRRPIERTTPEHQHSKDERKHGRFLKVEALQERCGNTCRQQPKRDVIGRVHAPKKRARQHKESQADDAAGKMRKLEDCERHDIAQHREARVHAGRRTRYQQNEACDEGQRAGHLRHDRCDVQRGERVSSCERPALGAQLLYAEEQRRRHERRQIIDGSVDEHRAQERAQRHVGQRANTITVSNTPKPPGTWLTMPAVTAAA